MRCECCNVILTDLEASRRSAETGEYLMICDRCLDGLDIATVGYDNLYGPKDIPLEGYTDGDEWLSSDDRY